MQETSVATNIIVCSDIHLDHLSPKQVIAFGEEMGDRGVSAILIAGDISSSERLAIDLALLAASTKPTKVYYVLGNHDAFNSSIQDVQEMQESLENLYPTLNYLSTTDYLLLTKSTAVIGQDGWYDFEYGDGGGRFLMAEWNLTHEFKGLGINDIKAKSKQLAWIAAIKLETSISVACRDKRVKNIVVVTHVPPFEEASMYKGRRSDSYALPTFTSKVIGEALLTAAAEHPDINFEVFAGHTHGAADVKVAANMRVRVQECEYRDPRFKVISIP